MARAKGIMLAFRAFRKAAQAPILTQSRKLLPSAGDNLVDIGLMAHIKNYFILGRGENTV